MFNKVIPAFVQSVRSATLPNGQKMSRAAMSTKAKISDEEFDENYVKYFSNKNIDGWELRKGMQDLHVEDLVLT